MSEAFRAYIALRSPLQTIITNRSCGLQPGLNIRLIDDVALLSRITPDSSETIGLQFEFDRKLILGTRVLFLQTANAGLNSK